MVMKMDKALKRLYCVNKFKQSFEEVVLSEIEEDKKNGGYKLCELRLPSDSERKENRSRVVSGVRGVGKKRKTGE